jgi:hypothetical protein
MERAPQALGHLLLHCSRRQARRRAGSVGVGAGGCCAIRTGRLLSGGIIAASTSDCVRRVRLVCASRVPSCPYCLVLDQRMDQHILPTSLKLEKTAEPHRFRRRGAEPAQSSLCSPAHRFRGQVTVAERFRRGPKAVEVRGGAHVVLCFE